MRRRHPAAARLRTAASAASWVAALWVGAGCGVREVPPPPRAEFLLAAGDSTFWVRSDSTGLHVRGSPMLLARFGRRLYEIYAADDDRSYYDAVFVGQRVFRRDLVSGDSLLVYQDVTVPALARAYAAAHPDEDPLDPDEDASEEPRTLATAEVDVVDLHGPFASFEYHGDVERDGAERSHVTRRGVIDLRTGREVSVADVFGDTAGARIVAGGRRAFAAALDSVRRARDPRARRARRAIAAFAFDPRSFAIVDVDRQPAVEFLVPGRGRRAEGATMPLQPIPAPSAAWWAEVRAVLPQSADSTADRWRRPGYEVVARYDSTGAVTLALRDTLRHEWIAGRMPGPAHRIYWLDRPPLDSATRHGLARAFDEAALYSDDARSASLDRRPTPGEIPVVFARYRRR